MEAAISGTRGCDRWWEAKYCCGGYKTPLPVEAQIDILRSHWPQLNPDKAVRYTREVYPTLQVPGWVEGLFAVIRPGFFGKEYEEEVEEVLSALTRDQGLQKRIFFKQVNKLEIAERTINAYRKILEQQNGSDILIVGSQFGIRYRWNSANQARKSFGASEFGQDIKGAALMALTNPDRLKYTCDLPICCPGNNDIVQHVKIDFLGMNHKSSGNVLALSLNEWYPDTIELRRYSANHDPLVVEGKGYYPGGGSVTSYLPA